jgi:hypothetical protein
MPCGPRVGLHVVGKKKCVSLTGNRTLILPARILIALISYTDYTYRVLCAQKTRNIESGVCGYNVLTQTHLSQRSARQR